MKSEGNVIGLFTLVVEKNGEYSFVSSIPLIQVSLLVQRLVLEDAREVGKREVEKKKMGEEKEQ